MVNSKRYDPTITRFQKHTKSFVSGKTKKGHLNKDEEREGDVLKEEGTLVKVDKNNFDGKGWLVKVDNKQIWCTYGDNIVYLPPCNLVGSYYVPKDKCPVEVSIDKKSKINTITRINDENKLPIAMMDGGITLESKEGSSIKINDEGTSISGISLNVENDVKIKTSKETISVKDTINNLYERIEYLESKESDSNDI